jgi:CubicO group peptidase (beta-lactamase class C family)
MIQNVIFILLATVLFSVTALAQTFNKAKLDSLFCSLEQEKRAMGSLAISKSGKILYTKTIGYSLYKRGKKIISTEYTKYRVGSISKMFTATMIFQLEEEGKLSLDNSLEKYFPQIPNSKNITIGNLLNHRSGFQNFTHVNHKRKAKTREEMLTIVSRGRIEQAGQKTIYSNANYLLLGYIIEKVCKQSLEDVLNERIISKIGLINTYYGHDPDVKKNECYSYKLKSDWRQNPAIDLSIVGGSGAIISTPADLIRFIEALFSNKLISQNSLGKMKNIVDEEGMGMEEYSFYTKKAYGHPGGIDAFESIVAYFPEDSLAISYCSNGQVYPVENIVVGALSIYYGKLFSLPSFKKTVVRKAILKKYCGSYSSIQTHLNLVITKRKEFLFAKVTGFPSYPIAPVEKNKFVFELADVIIEFNPRNNELKLKQGGINYSFIKSR